MFQLTLFRKSISYCGADPLSDDALLTASIAHQWMEGIFVHVEIQAALMAGCIVHRDEHTDVSLSRIASHRNGPHSGVMQHVESSWQPGTWGWALSRSLHRLRGEHDRCQHKHDEHRQTDDRPQILFHVVMSPILQMFHYKTYYFNYTKVLSIVNFGKYFTRLFTLNRLEHHLAILPHPFLPLVNIDCPMLIKKNQHVT
jgi:hypothetical protein